MITVALSSEVKESLEGTKIVFFATASKSGIPNVAVTWWGDKGGFQVKGTVTIHTDDKVFSDDVD